MRTWSEMKEIQPLASQMIINSIRKDRISHAYLLHGERGTGKENMAILLTKVLFCLERDGVDPCQECVNCKRIESRNHPDVHWIEPDGKSIKKEQVENLQKEFTYSGLESNRKVYVIKEADTLTVNASNRILKFLEEPTRQTTAILLTENSQSILSTIQSRCQIIDLKPLNPQAFQERLIESGVEKQTATLLSALTNNYEEALGWSQDEWFAEIRILVIKLVETLSFKPEDIYLFIHSHLVPQLKERSEQEHFLDLCILAFKDILYYHVREERKPVFFSHTDTLLERAAMSFPEERIVNILNAILQAKRKLKQNVQATLVLEQLMLQIQR